MNTTTANTTATVDTSILGKGPLGSTLKMFGILFAIPVAMFVTGNKELMLMAFFLVVLLGLPVLFFGAGKLGQSIRGNGFYKNAVAAITSGRITPSFVGRGHSCLGIVVVDEKNRQIYVNDELVGFSEVESTETGTFKGTLTYLDIMLRSGTNPTQRVVFDDERSAKTFQQRLHNAMRAR